MKTTIDIVLLSSLQGVLAFPAAIFWWAAVLKARIGTRPENLNAPPQ